MKEENKTYVSPLLSFDMYLEHYHKLCGRLRRKNDVTQLQSILKSEIASKVRETILEEEYDALVLTKSNQNIVWVSNGFQEMTGYSKSFALGKKPHFLQGPKTSKTIKLKIREQLKHRHGYKGSIINYHKNGETYICHIKIIPIYDRNNILTNFLALEKELPAA